MTKNSPQQRIREQFYVHRKYNMIKDLQSEFKRVWIWKINIF